VNREAGLALGQTGSALGKVREMRTVGGVPWLGFLLVLAPCTTGCGEKRTVATQRIQEAEDRLLELVLEGDLTSIHWWGERDSSNRSLVDGPAKARIVRTILQKHFDKRHEAVCTATTLESPESIQYLRVLYLSGLDSDNSTVRGACFQGLVRIDPRLARDTALAFHWDKNTSVVRAGILVRHCDSEAMWTVLQHWYSEIRGKPELRGAWTTLECYYINLSMPQARAAYERRRRAQEAGEDRFPPTGVWGPPDPYAEPGPPPDADGAGQDVPTNVEAVAPASPVGTE